MTTLKNSFTGLALAVGLSLPAQGPTDRSDRNHLVEGPQSVLRQAHGIALDDGVLWGLGAGYRASFTGGGMEYTPALGPGAPTSQSLRIRLQSISRGGTVLHDAGARPMPKASRTGDAVAYRHAPGLLEKFDIRADGVELSYTFSDPLPGSGDLVVRAWIDTELSFRPTDEGDVRFLLDEVGGVRIGEVTGCDAAGSRVAGSLRCDGSRLEMRLPAAFVDNAVYPLVLDPLIGATFLVTGANCVEPAVAYDLTNDVYLVVMRQTFSAGDSQIVAQRVSGAGTLAGSLIAVTSASGVAVNPTVANHNGRDKFLVAWQQAANMFGPWDIACRTVDAGTGSLSAIVPVANGARDETDPAAASGETGRNYTFLLVWREKAAGIKGTTVNLPVVGGPTVGAITAITGTGSAIRPSISKSHASTLRYAVVWEEVATPPNRVIKARAVTRTMALLGTELAVISGGSRNPYVYNPDVDGDGTDFMVVYDRPEFASVSERNVLCQMIQWTGTDLARVGTSAVVAGDTGDDEFDPAVGWLGNKYVVLWADAAGTFNYNIEGAELAPNCQPCGNGFVLTGPPRSPFPRPMELDPAIGTQRAGGAASDEALIVFVDSSVSPPFSSDIVAQRIEGFGGGAVVDLGGGCGNGGTAGTNGPSALGNSDFRVTLTGAAPGAPLTFLGVDFSGATTSCAPCTVIDASYWFFALPSAGNASFPLGIPCKPFLQGLPVHAQWAVFLSGVSPCFLAPPGVQASFSNRIRTVVDF